MIELFVNNYLKLRLEDNKTNIYVDGKLFNQCKFLLLEVPLKDYKSLDKIKSIDKAAEYLNRKNELDRKIRIPPKAEFWAHCSNLQVWFENNYDTRLLHRSLAFPLLRCLADAGDTIAINKFKEEIAKRIREGFKPVILYLINEDYLDYLSVEEVVSILEDLEPSILFDYDMFFSTFDYFISKEMFNSIFFEPRYIQYLKVFPSGEGYEDVFSYIIDNYLQKEVLVNILNSLEFNDIKRLSHLNNELGISLLIKLFFKLEELSYNGLKDKLSMILDNSPSFFYQSFAMSNFFRYFPLKIILSRLLHHKELILFCKLYDILKSDLSIDLKLIIEDYFDVYSIDGIPCFYIKGGYISGIYLPLDDLGQVQKLIYMFTHLERLRLKNVKIF